MADEVQVANRRIDASGNEALTGIARMGADAFGYTADLLIDRGLAELLRLRVSQLNNCTYCLNLHYEAARKAGIPRGKIDTLTAWWETEFHSEAEQAALRYTEALTGVADTDRDAAFQRFHRGAFTACFSSTSTGSVSSAGASLFTASSGIVRSMISLASWM